MQQTLQQPVPELLEDASPERLRFFLELSREVTRDLEALYATALARECPVRPA